MRKFTLGQYKRMAQKFNDMSFKQKIETVRANKDILTLASDHNWWGVKVKDKEIQEQLEDAGEEFNIEREWDSNEINVLVGLLGIDNTDI